MTRLDDKINEINDLLLGRAQLAHDNVQKYKSYKGSHDLERAVRTFDRTNNYIHNFNIVTENLPAYFIMSIERIKVQPSSVVNKLRRHFNKSVRKSFFESLDNKSDRAALKAMRLNHEQIEVLCKAVDMPVDHQGRRLNITVDHILDLTYCGTNELENMSAIPLHINNLFNYFSDFQVKSLKMNEVIMLKPAHDTFGNTPKVPFFPEGFQEQNDNRSNVWRRIDRHFGGTYNAPVLKY